MIKLLGSQNTADVVDRFAAEKASLNLTERDSTMTLTLGPTAPEISVGAWLQDEDDPGAGIVWMVRSVKTDYKTGTRTVQCEHAIMVLKEFLLFGEITPAVITGNSAATSCTADETFRYILSQQNIWRFGSVLYNDTQAYNFNGDDLYTALETISATIPEAWWEYDFSQVPYVISIVEKPEWYIGQLSELRMNRNLKSLNVTVDRHRMYTRFYPIGRNNLMLPEKYVSRNENLYGIVSQTETDENRTTAADLRKWANERLDNHAEPQVTVSCNAMDLSAITGEDLDSFVLGAHCTIALPEYGATIYERIVSLQWPDKVKDRTDVSITMANAKEDLAKVINKATKKTSTGRRSSAASVGRSLKDVTLTGPANNVYTLSKVLTSGETQQIGTFSRAVAQWVVDVPTGGTIRVTAKPQEQSKNLKIRGNTGSWSGNNYTGLIQYSDDDGSHWFSSGARYTVDATPRYYAGWDNAAGMSEPAPVMPNGISGNYTEFAYSYPSKQTDQSGTVQRIKVTDTLTLNNSVTPSFSGYVTVKRGAAGIARVNVGNWYAAGWDAAAELSEAVPVMPSPASGDYTEIVYSFPLKQVNQDGSVTRSKYTDTLTLYNGNTPGFSGYVTVKRGNAGVARINVGNWYAAGWDAAAALSEAVPVMPSGTSGDYTTFSYSYPLKQTDSGGTITRTQVTDTLTLYNGNTPSSSGYVTVKRGNAGIARVNVGNWWTAGWDDASALSTAAPVWSGEGDHTEFSYSYPLTETIGGTVTRHQVTDTLTLNNNATPSSSGYVTLTRGQALIARVNVGNWYTAGYNYNLPNGIDVGALSNAGTSPPSGATLISGHSPQYIKNNFSGYGYLKFNVTVHGKTKTYYFAFDNR